MGSAGQNFISFQGHQNNYNSFGDKVTSGTGTLGGKKDSKMMSSDSNMQQSQLKQYTDSTLVKSGADADFKRMSKNLE